MGDALRPPLFKPWTWNMGGVQYMAMPGNGWSALAHVGNPPTKAENGCALRLLKEPVLFHCRKWFRRGAQAQCSVPYSTQRWFWSILSRVLLPLTSLQPVGIANLGCSSGWRKEGDSLMRVDTCCVFFVYLGDHKIADFVQLYQGIWTWWEQLLVQEGNVAAVGRTPGQL